MNWVLAKDHFPNKTGTYLVFQKNRTMQVLRFYVGDQDWWLEGYEYFNSHKFDGNNVLFWTLLPEEPKY